MPKSNQNSAVTKFFNAIDKHPCSSLYILCDLVLTHTKDARKNIDNIVKNISAEQLNKIIGKMIYLETKERALQDTTTLTAFAQFKTKLLCDEVWFKHLKPKDIISLSANDEFYLHGLIALTRKHAKAQGCADPFLKFDFDILQRAGAEHITFQIAAFITKSDSLPLDGFKAFSKGDIKLARSVLELMQSHPARFEMGEYFLTQHKELKKEIYNSWHKTKDSALLTKSTKVDLIKSVKIVGEIYPEFNTILKTERIKRDLPDTKNEVKRNYDALGLAGLGTLGMAINLVPKYAALTTVMASASNAALAGQAVCVSCLSAAALPVIAPTSVALFMGGVTYLARNGVEENKAREEKSKSPPWALNPFKLGV